MALKNRLKGGSDDKKPKRKKAIKKQPKIDSETLQHIEDLLLCEPPPSKLKHTDNVDRLISVLENQLSEWLKSFALVGFTDDGIAIEIGYAPTPMDEQALDGMIHQLYASRAAINNINLKERLQQYFRNDEEQ